jgi:hypothetical protein
MEKQVVGGKLLRACRSLFLRDIDNSDIGDLVNQFSSESSTIFVYCLSLKDFKYQSLTLVTMIRSMKLEHEIMHLHVYIFS